ncbi:MAG TPA: DPP IV N-terminal domain-containing protein [Novosphingobium sp.]|nr:DPP IV N-terminal domain-containing protein [Novosphingobium sp.]
MRLFPTLLLAVGLAVFASRAGAQERSVTAPATAPKLSFERVFASPSLAGVTPREVKLSPDGRWVTVLRNRADDRERYDLWGFDRTSGEWRMLVDSAKLGSGRELSEAEKMQRERARLAGLKGIVAYQWTADSRALLVPLDGEIHLAGLDGTVRKLGAAGTDPLNPALSPEGRYLSFVRERRLWVGALEGAASAVTPEETAETVHWGEAEFVAQEEMNRSKGFWWSPDDKRLAVERFDEAPVGVVTRAAIGAEGTTTFAQRYPVAGSANALVSLWLVDPDGGHRVEVDLGPDRDIYLARVDWAPDAGTLYVQRVNRAQTRLDMLAVDPATGQSRVLFSEKAAAKSWINLSDSYRLLEDGSLVWWSERDGFGHLYRFNRGKWRRLTQGPWVVTSLAGIDEAAGRVVFTGTRDDALAEQVYSVGLDGGKVERLSDPGFVNAASMDKAGKTLVVTRSAEGQPPQSYIADAAGKRIAWIEENRVEGDHPYAPFLAGHAHARFGTIPASDGTPLHWMMLTPPLEPGKRYPVFTFHYGGPHNQSVTKAWKGALPQAIVDAGYIWFALDNRGSDHRGVAFESAIWRAMGGVEVEDQFAGADWLKSQSFVDPNKIATFGWSYGGFLTLKMMARDPGAYAAGIAVAPVTRWGLYDTFYTERYLGDPNADPAAYARSDSLEDADRIRDPLLVIHGMADDNVVFENTTALAARLQGRAAPFEMMLYPGSTHAIAGAKRQQHVYETIFRFLDKHGVGP